MSQDELSNTKELKHLPPLKKDLPGIYHTASFATGLLLALSLKQLRSVRKQRRIRTWITTHKVHFRPFPEFSPWLAGHCLEVMDFPSCQQAAAWHQACLCTQHSELGFQGKSLNFSDTFPMSVGLCVS